MTRNGAMFAVVETGGKQYRVSLGDSFQVEKLPGVKGDRVEFERVLLIADGDQVTAGTPTVAGARVLATVSRQERGPKIRVFRYKSKKRVRVATGHRQSLTRLFIRDIVVNGESAAERVREQRGAQASVAAEQPTAVSAAPVAQTEATDASESAAASEQAQTARTVIEQAPSPPANGDASQAATPPATEEGA